MATIQRHTKCSPAYCLKNGPKGITKCRFNFPKQLEAKSRLEIKKDDITLLTRRNDPLVNSYNPVQLVSWRANVDLQACVSRHKVVSYTAKYASKSEPRSKTLAEIFSKILENKEDVTNKKLAQKILIESVANRDYPAAEVCHLLLQLPLYTSSRDFVTLNLDDSLQVVCNPDSNKRSTVSTLIEIYKSRPNTPLFEELTLLEFVARYRRPKKPFGELTARNKDAIVVVQPRLTPDEKKNTI